MTEPTSAPIGCTPPEDAVELYLRLRANEFADSSLQNIRCRLGQFVKWTDEVGSDNISDLDGMLCEQYKLARLDDGLT